MVSFLSWSLTIIYPGINFLLAALFLFYTRNLPYQREFIILGISSLVSGCIQSLEFLLRLQKYLDVVLISREVARQLWWIRAPLDILSITLYVIAIFLLIRKMHSFHSNL